MIDASGCDSSTTAFDTVRNGAEPLLATKFFICNTPFFSPAERLKTSVITKSTLCHCV